MILRITSMDDMNGNDVVINDLYEWMSMQYAGD